jgi:REP element-mobilizing transposase RayT
MITEREEGNFPQFFTATILEWRMLLENDLYKEIVIDSLLYLVRKKKVIVYGFVIMPNHVHIVWQVQPGHKREDVQRDFMKYTAQMMLRVMMTIEPEKVPDYHVNAVDRKYQFWERNPLTIDLYNRKTLEQKMAYVHNNPVQEAWRLCVTPEEYKYSSAFFYLMGGDTWNFLTHYME